MDLRALVAQEAEQARSAVEYLDDASVRTALLGAAGYLGERVGAVLDANRQDVQAAEGTLDAGTLDRLRLDETRLSAMADQLSTMAALDPLERTGDSWRLGDGTQVIERRLPIGVVGANFEARPNVAVDVAAQLLKSLNGGVLRTGGAALGTVTTLIDHVMRPALEEANLPPGSIGLVRAAEREGARVLVSLPKLIPLVILRGSGPVTAALSRRAAEHGVTALAHAEGGGVLYVHESARRPRVLELVEESLDRLGVCNRLNLLLVDRKAVDVLAQVVELVRGLGLEVRGTERACAATDARVDPLDVRLGHEWANDAERVATITVDLVDDVKEATRLANRETSGLAAAIVAEDTDAAEAFLDGYRGTAAYWDATTRLTDGFKLTGAPETGINVDWSPGPRGPVTYRDLWLRQYRVLGSNVSLG